MRVSSDITVYLRSNIQFTIESRTLLRQQLTRDQIVQIQILRSINLKYTDIARNRCEAIYQV